MSRTTSPDKRQRLVHILREAKQLLLGPRDDPTPLYRHGPFDLERQRAAEAGILEAIASDAPLPDVLRQIALAVDALNPGIVCSILLLDADLVHLRLGAAPHLPDAIARAFDGQPIGPNAGSCGTAAFTGQPVIVADIATDPRWTGFREPMQGSGFRACWSVPVLDAAGRVLATFALYGREARAPDDGQIEMIARFAHLVGIAVERTRRREELRASEERFRSIYRSVAVSIWEEDWTGIMVILDELRAQGIHDFRKHAASHPEIMQRLVDAVQILDVNEPTLTLFGARDKDEIERLLKAGALSTDVRTAFVTQIAGFAEGRSIFEDERTFRTRAGETIHTLMRIAYPAAGSGSGRVLVSLMDVTAQKRLEAERASLAARLGATLENMTDAFCLVDRDWRFTYLNAEAERVLQRHRTDLLGRSMWAEFPEARDTAIHAMYVDAMRDGLPRHMEFFYPPLDEWFDVKAYPSSDGLAIYFRVITEKKQFDEQRRLSEERFRQIASATTDVISDWDLKTGVMWWGEGYTTIFGYPAAETLLGWDSWTHSTVSIAPSN